jgi:fucose 4-O-acetylase-like acetyltransferase
MPTLSTPPTTAVPVANRSWYLDNLKILLTLLVVAHHAAQAYGPTGGSWPVGQPERAEALGPFITLNSMFFMGLFFFISGYFTTASFARKGTRAFVVDRLLRFGLPALAWLPVHRLTDGSWGWEFAHLWLVVDLLGLNLLYAAWRMCRPAVKAPAEVVSAGSPPGDATILGFILLLGCLTMLVRIGYPVDRWIRFLGVFPMEPAHWPQYLSLFVLGFWASRTRWLDLLPAAQGRRWLYVAVAASTFYTVYRLMPGRTVHWFSTGGYHWQTWSYATLEALICIALCIALLWLFRDFFNHGRAWLRTLAADSYGIYWIHVIPVVGIQMCLRGASLGPLGKFFITTIAGLLASWAIAHFVLRRGWLARRVF